MSNNDTNTNLLIQYLDNELDDAAKAEVEKRLRAEAELKEQLSRLQLSREAIRLYGLTQRVNEIGSEFRKNQTTVVPMHTARIRRIARWSFGVAAVLFLVVAGIGLYEYATMSNNKLYAELYTPYEVRSSRGNANTNDVESAYTLKDYQQAIANFQSRMQHSTADYFFAGQAYLEQDNAKEAISYFEKALRSSQTSHQLADESEFYLALAYLKSNELSKAQPLFENIHANQKHLFHKQVSSWFMKKFHLLEKK